MNKKQIIIVIGILVLACCCVTGLTLTGFNYLGTSIGSTIENADDPESVARIASSIADYDIPAGYEQKAFEMLSIKYVFMTSSNEDAPLIMLVQFPKNMASNQEEMQKEMERAMARQSGQVATAMKAVEEKAYTIRGQEVQATIMEGETEVEGSRIVTRQMIVIFQGKTGIAALMFLGSKDGWDQEKIDSFVESLR